MNYSRFITEFAQRRKPSLIRELTKLYAKAPPETVFLAGGLPNSSMFPFEEAKILLKDGSSFTMKGKTLDSALQYGPSQGLLPLLAKLKELQKRIHNPPQWENTDLLVTVGSLDGLSKVIEMVLEEGEPVVIQDPLYSGTMAILGPFKPQYIPIKEDCHGMSAEHLRRALSSQWKPEDKLKVKGVPKLLYINPTGSNPSGVNVSNDRKKEIYKIACEYDMLILEDDPYYFLHFEKENPQSFLSLDTEGRVIRFDSFSKVLSSGLRLGFVTGPKPIIQNLELHVQASILHASSFSQALVNQIFEHWGVDKLMDHFKHVQDFYAGKRDIMVKLAEKHLKGLAEWNVPAGGMFLWMKINGVKDVYDMIMERGLKNNVMCVPGHAFMIDPEKPCQFVRASFSTANEEEIDRGFACLARLIKEEQLRNKA